MIITKILAICSVVIVVCGCTTLAQPNTKPQSVPRIVLAECFTGTWCGYCPGAEGALNKLANEMPRTKLAIIEWHVKDKYEIPDGKARSKNFYTIPGVPITFFDGLNPTIGGSTSPDDPQTYNDYKKKIEDRLKIPSPLKIDMKGTMTSVEGKIDVSVYADETPTLPYLGVYFVVCEDHNTTETVSGRIYWLRFTAVKNLTMEKISISQGQTLKFQRNFSIESGWKKDRIWVVTFVQTHKRDYHGGQHPYHTAEILQTNVLNLSQFIPEFGVVVIPIGVVVVVFQFVAVWRVRKP